MAILAVQAIRRLRGGSQSQLILGADGNLWVVKFQNNPQHLRVLANEFFVSGLASAAGFTIPNFDVIEVTPWLVEHSIDLEVNFGRGHRERCLSGRHFGSLHVGGLDPGGTVDYLPDLLLEHVVNFEEFTGILALDKWTCNADGRQAVFHRQPNQSRYRASFIDHGFCFNAGDWDFPDSPIRGAYARNSVYERVTGWGSFSPWLEILEEMSPETIWEKARVVPSEWYGQDTDAMEELVHCLVKRRSRIRELILAFRNSERHPFPNWAGRPSFRPAKHEKGLEVII